MNKDIILKEEKNIVFVKGGNGGITPKVTIPKKFLEALGIDQDHKEVVISLTTDKKIIIEKK